MRWGEEGGRRDLMRKICEGRGRGRWVLEESPSPPLVEQLNAQKKQPIASQSVFKHLFLFVPLVSWATRGNGHYFTLDICRPWWRKHGASFCLSLLIPRTVKDEPPTCLLFVTQWNRCSSTDGNSVLLFFFWLRVQISFALRTVCNKKMCSNSSASTKHHCHSLLMLQML